MPGSVLEDQIQSYTGRQYRQALLDLADKKLPMDATVRQIGGNAIKNPDRTRSQDIQDETLKPYIQDFLKDYMKEHPELEFNNDGDLRNAGLIRSEDLAKGRPWLTNDDINELSNKPKYVPESTTGKTFYDALKETPIKRWNAVTKAGLYKSINQNILGSYNLLSNEIIPPAIIKLAEKTTYDILNKLDTLNSKGAEMTSTSFYRNTYRPEFVNYVLKEVGQKLDRLIPKSYSDSAASDFKDMFGKVIHNTVSEAMDSAHFPVPARWKNVEE
jgi:hypothetical protein